MYDIETQALKRGDDLFVSSARRVRQKVQRGEIIAPTPRSIKKISKLGKKKILARPGEVEAQTRLLDRKEGIRAQKQLVDIAKIRVDRSMSRRGIPIDFSGFEEVDIDEDELRRLDAEMRGEKPPKPRGKGWSSPGERATQGVPLPSMAINPAETQQGM